MNKLTSHIKFITLGAGALGLLLRIWLLLGGVDEKGLFSADHPASPLCFILTALVLAALALAVRPLKPVRSYSKLFPASASGMIGCFIGAAGMVITAVTEYLSQKELLALIALVLGIAAGVCLVLLGLCRKKGNRPHFLLRTALTGYLMLQLVLRYRFWSSEPQLHLYFFPLLASVFLMLAAYHNTILDAQKSSRRWFVFCNQAAVFFCFMSLPGENWLFYLTVGIYCVTNLCSVNYQPYAPKYSKEAVE